MFMECFRWLTFFICYGCTIVLQKLTGYLQGTAGAGELFSILSGGASVLHLAGECAAVGTQGAGFLGDSF